MQHNLEADLIASKAICHKVQTSDVYAQNLYAALCNNVFQKNEVVSRLKNDTWSCSWRRAGSMMATIKGHGDYLDYYCSGVGSDSVGIKAKDLRVNEFVPEGQITNEIRDDLFALGWIVIESLDN